MFSIFSKCVNMFIQPVRVSTTGVSFVTEKVEAMI